MRKYDENRLFAYLDEILRGVRFIAKVEVFDMVKIQEIQQQADEVLAAIEQESVKDDAIIALVDGNTAILAALQAKLDEAIANGADPGLLQGVSDSLMTAKTSSLANAQKVVDAINRNTPPVAA